MTLGRSSEVVSGQGAAFGLRRILFGSYSWVLEFFFVLFFLNFEPTSKYLKFYLKVFISEM